MKYDANRKQNKTNTQIVNRQTYVSVNRSAYEINLFCFRFHHRQ